ncbi:MAG: surface glycoprotein [Halobacteriales archaeon]|nr:surface glycoprotein [Halobacteriales archaeon]
MTSTNDKVRALFLTALMVVSVFGATVAFTGSAASALRQFQGPSNRYDNKASSTAIEVVFNKPATRGSGLSGALTVSNFTVYQNGNNISTGVGLDRVRNDASRYVLTLPNDVTPNASLTLSVNNVTDGTDSTSIDNTSVTVTAGTI